jgi:hypothetical protein
MPFRLVDAAGVVVEAAAAFFAELAALGRPAATHRSYGMDLLRWFRFIWAAGVPWDQATRAEARDFCRWIQLTVKPGRQGGQRGGGPGGSAAGAPNAVTGKPAPGRRYAAATCAQIAITMEIYTMVPDKATLAALKRLSDALSSPDAALPNDAN